MPVRYRCPTCRQLLSIATRMVGQTVNCPTCGTGTIVPEHDEPLDLPGDQPAAGPASGPVSGQVVAPESIAAGAAGAIPGIPEDCPVWFQDAEALGTPREVPGEQEPGERGALVKPAIPLTAATIQQRGAALEPDPTPVGAATSDGSGGFSFGRRKLDTEEMDLTPMVDMTFLLLIFFMITASFSLQ